MAKKKSPIVTTQVVSLLDQMQKRISAVATRGGENSNTIAVLEAKIDNVTRNSAAGFVEQKQAIADNATGTTYALESSKTSTQHSFDNVKIDIKAASDCAQRHNARISKLEGNADKTALDVVGVRVQQMAFDDRLARLEVKKKTNTEADSLEEELKELLKRHGYDVSGVSIKRAYYNTSPIGSFSYGTFPPPVVLNEGITVEVCGSKAL